MTNTNIKKTLLAAQRSEITEHFIYKKLSQVTQDPHNKKILTNISEDELKHYYFWKQHTKQDVKPNRWQIWKFYWISKIFGLTFGIQLMEKGEEKAQVTYDKISEVIPEAQKIVADEDAHEKQLIALIDEERLRYIGSVVLGLNDALVELTGTLAGLTLAFQNTRLIALAGSITGIAASLSMAASEYLSTKAEDDKKHPLKASLYTGLAYVLTVVFLISPYLIFTNYFLCLGITLLNAVIVIYLFTFYISVAKELPFKRRFFEMVAISLGIALLSFGIGLLIRIFFNIEL